MIRKAIVRSIPRGNEAPQTFGQLVDDGQSEPYGTTPMTDQMLRADRRERFDRYYKGYSNGFTYETVPDVAISHPEQWRQYLDRLHEGNAEPFDQFVASVKK